MIKMIQRGIRSFSAKEEPLLPVKLQAFPFLGASVNVFFLLSFRIKSKKSLAMEWYGLVYDSRVNKKHARFDEAAISAEYNDSS